LQKDQSSASQRKSDPRWLRSRERFLRVGFDLFGEFGAEGVSVDALIQRAGVSKQTFYNHFSDRDALLRELWLESRRIFERIVDATNADVSDPARRLIRGVSVYARMAIDDRLHSQFVVRAPANAASAVSNVNAGLERDLAEGLSSGRFNFRTLGAATVFVEGTTRSLMERILDESVPISAVGISQEILSLMLRAFGIETKEADLLSAQTALDIVGGGCRSPDRRYQTVAPAGSESD
jgi:AcrR family transcriptional regulator